MPAIERPSGSRALLVARAVAAEQLDLDRVHRIDVRVADPDRAADDRAPLEQPLLADDREHRSDRALVLGGDRAEEALRLELGRDELEVLAGHLEARLRERHLQVVDQRAEERQLLGRGAAARRRRRPRRPCRSRTRPGAASGSASSRRPTGSRAASRGSRRRSGRRAGREPIASSASSSTGVKARKKSTKPGALPDERAVRGLGEPGEPLEQPRARRRSGVRPTISGKALRTVPGERRLEVAVGDARAGRT